MNSLPWTDLVLGATALLALGLAASLLLSSPHERHRAGAVTVVALLLWLGLALVPLPRFSATVDQVDLLPTVTPAVVAARPDSAPPIERRAADATLGVRPETAADAWTPTTSAAIELSGQTLMRCATRIVRFRWIGMRP